MSSTDGASRRSIETEDKKQDRDDVLPMVSGRIVRKWMVTIPATGGIFPSCMILWR